MSFSPAGKSEHAEQTEATETAPLFSFPPVPSFPCLPRSCSFAKAQFVPVRSISARTKEIGVRKAIGAKRRDIISQFLVEAATLTGLGGLLGGLFGWGLAEIVKLVMPTFVPL